jgi:hypothetical protein
MITDNKAVNKPGVVRSPIFWLSMISVIAGTLISAKFFLGPYGEPWSVQAIMIVLGQIGFAITQVGALILGLLRLRQNRPLGLGLLIGLLVMDLGTIILGLGLLALLQMSGALRDF